MIPKHIESHCGGRHFRALNACSIITTLGHQASVSWLLTFPNWKNDYWHSAKIFSNKNQLLRHLRISSMCSEIVSQLYFLSLQPINKHNDIGLHPFHDFRSLECKGAFAHWFQAEESKAVFLGIPVMSWFLFRFFIYVTGFEIIKN